MPSLLLVDYLQRSRAQYTLHNVPAACTAQQTAHLARILPRRFAKAVMVRVDGELMMLVMPANYRLHCEALRAELGAKKVELASERHFQRRFPRCELGAIPPFGHLFGLRTLLIDAFDEFGDIHFKAGAHDEVLRMPFFEFKRLAHVESIARGAALHLRGPVRSHLQRLINLAHDRRTETLAAPLLQSS